MEDLERLAEAEMNQQEREALVAAAAAAVANAMAQQQQQAAGNQPADRLMARGALKPDRFPSTVYPTFTQWRNHLSWIVDANGWNDEQTIAIIPTCLTGWAFDEWMAMPANLRTQVAGQPAPTVVGVFDYRAPRMEPYRNQRTARTDFKNLFQEANEGIKEFSRRVRAVGEIANVHLPANARDDMCREQFIEGLSDLEIQEMLLREDPPTFNDAVTRAVALQAILTGTRARRKKAAVRQMGEYDDMPGATATVSTVAAGGMNRPQNSGMGQPPYQPRRGEPPGEIEDLKKKVDKMADTMTSLADTMAKMMGSMQQPMPMQQQQVPQQPPMQQQPQQMMQPQQQHHQPSGGMLYNPYPPQSRQGRAFARNGPGPSQTMQQPQQQMGPSQGPEMRPNRGCFHCGSMEHWQKWCPMKKTGPLN